MSIFQSFSRILQGKPVFTPDQQTTPMVPQPTGPPVAQASGIVKGDAHTFPVVYVKRTITRLSSTDMQVYCYIRNNSPYDIELDKIQLLGTTHELDASLHAGGEREFLVYKGRKLQNGNYHEARLDYKTHPSGDYFEAIHDVRYSYHPDKTYTIDELRLRPPIRDIYG